MSLITLRTLSGRPVFPVGIGTFGIAGRENPATAETLRYVGYKNIEPVTGSENAEIAGLTTWLTGGANYLDTAELYGAGYTQTVIGRAIAAAGIPRTSLFISGNVWKSSYGDVRKSVEGMLGRLGIDYLDAAGLHSPHTDGWQVPRWESAIAPFRALIAEGIVRGLSVSNFSTIHMAQAMTLTGLPITTAQMGFSINYQKEVTMEFRTFCAAHSIQIVAYQPLQPNVIGNRVVREVASARKATPAQVALAWTIQMGTLPITKTVREDRIRENLGAPALRLTNDEMELLSSEPMTRATMQATREHT
jgi:diketogulonate reductase-like aldo/keto reductase